MNLVYFEVKDDRILVEDVVQALKDLLYLLEKRKVSLLEIAFEEAISKELYNSKVGLDEKSYNV